MSRGAASKLAAALRRWDLVQSGDPFRRTPATLVTPVRDLEGRECVLKLFAASEDGRREAICLRHYDGRGSVRLLDADTASGSLLLLRLKPGRSLSSATTDDAEEARVVGRLVRRLTAARETMPALPTLLGEIRRSVTLTRTSVRRRQRLDESMARLEEEGGLSAATTVLHGDLHPENILLSASSGWTAIDPKGLPGPPEAEGAAFLRNPRDRLLAASDPVDLSLSRARILGAETDADPSVLLSWAGALAVLAALWAEEDVEGEAEAARWHRCADILDQASSIIG